MWHPLAHLAPQAQRWVFVGAVGLSVVTPVAFAALGSRIRTGGAAMKALAPASRATQRIILNGWHEKGVVGYAWAFTVLDFGFIVGYATAIALACLWNAAGLPNSWTWLTTAGVLIAWSQSLGALVDVSENVLLLRLLATPPGGDITMSAGALQLLRLCAQVKLACPVAGVAYATGVGAIRWCGRVV